MLFPTHRVALVEEAERFFKGRSRSQPGKPERASEDSEPVALLKRFAARKEPPATLILLMTLPPKAAEALGIGKVVPCWPLEDREGRPELTRWTLAQARNRTGKTLEPAAAAAILAHTGNALGRITNAVEALAIFIGGRATISAADVEALIGGNAQAHAFALAEAVSLGEPAKALRILRQQQEAAERPEAILAALIYHYRRLCQALALIEDGGDPSAAAESVGVKPMFRPPFLRALRRLTPQRGNEALALLRDADRKLKQGGGLSRAAMERLLTRLCSPVLARGKPRG